MYVPRYMFFTKGVGKAKEKLAVKLLVHCFQENS